MEKINLPDCIKNDPYRLHRDNCKQCQGGLINCIEGRKILLETVGYKPIKKVNEKL